MMMISLVIAVHGSDDHHRFFARNFFRASAAFFAFEEGIFRIKVLLRSIGVYFRSGEVAEFWYLVWGSLVESDFLF